MDHPLRSDDHKSLRRKLYKLVSNGFTIPRQSNIVFVCGGNDPHHMRRRFEDEFDALLPDYEFFKAEFAMRKYRTLGDSEPFDITTFEELVGNLSRLIVIFPEAAGSFAETGYFSARPDIAKKILLAINAAHLATDSFISIGPAKKIGDRSKFGPNIQFDYDNPNFKLISQRLSDRTRPSSTKRALKIKKFSNMDGFELFAIIQSIVALLHIATVDDVEFFLRGLFSGNIGPSKTKQVVSILMGSGRLVEVGQYGHLKASDEDNLILQIRDGARIERNVLKLDLSTIYLGADPEFRSLLEA